MTAGTTAGPSAAGVRSTLRMPCSASSRAFSAWACADVASKARSIASPAAASCSSSPGRPWSETRWPRSRASRSPVRVRIDAGQPGDPQQRTALDLQHQVRADVAGADDRDAKARLALAHGVCPVGSALISRGASSNERSRLIEPPVDRDHVDSLDQPATAFDVGEDRPVAKSLLTAPGEAGRHLDLELRVGAEALPVQRGHRVSATVDAVRCHHLGVVAKVRQHRLEVAAALVGPVGEDPLGGGREHAVRIAVGELDQLDVELTRALGQEARRAPLPCR